MQLKSSPELREIAREIAQITGSLTVPEINNMLAVLDLSRVEHRMIRVCLVAELEQREARFAHLYAARYSPRPSLLERTRDWVGGLVGRLGGLRSRRAEL